MVAGQRDEIVGDDLAGLRGPIETQDDKDARITKLERERDEARAEAKKWENRTRCLFTKYCSRTFDCPTEGYLERTIVKLDEEIAAVDKET